VRESTELLTRLDPNWLADAWVGDPLRARQVESIRDTLPGVALRYANFFATVGDGFDGDWSFEDADVAVLTIPSLASRITRTPRCGCCWPTGGTTPPPASPGSVRTRC
jgi:hypothetical protein